MAAELPFTGIKVLDVASFIAAPGAATVLSDFGADVIKVEPPGQGDPQRFLGSVPPSPVASANYNWHLANRNKRGVVVNLKSPGGTRILRRLVEWADVVITNFPHGVREGLHLGYDKVSSWNPRVVYADLTGFGDAGPDAELPGFDVTAFWSRSGLLASMRDAGAPPTVPVYGSGDYTTAIGIYAAIVTALYRRERTGLGANVGTSLLAEGVWSAGTLVAGALAGGRSFGLHDRTAPFNPLINPIIREQLTVPEDLGQPRPVGRRVRRVQAAGSKVTL
jgi:crotonobetainyl-CoA:carnitine CoA-transferase CaiB-like acyl-CoA transferase